MSVLCDGSPESAKLLIVVAGPSRDDAIAGRLLSDAAGAVFWRMLSGAGIDRADCCVVACQTEVIGWKKKPTVAGLESAWDEFTATLGKFSGRCVLCLGSDAFHRTTGLSGSHDEWAGYLIHPSERGVLTRRRSVLEQYKSANAKKGIRKGDPKVRVVKEAAKPFLPDSVEWVLTTQEPGAVLRSGFETAPIVKAHLAKVGRVIANSLRASRFEFVEAPIKTDELLFSIDIEGIDAIERVGIATATVAWSVPWDDSARDACQHFLGNPNATAILHNESYDYPMLKAAGIDIRCKSRDTMLMAALLAPDAKKGLNACGSTYLDCRRWKPPRNGKPTGSELLDQQSEAVYNALDNIRQFELHAVLEGHLRQTGQLGLFDNTIMKAMPVLMAMKKRGIGIDLERRDHWLVTLQGQLSEATMAWQDKYGLVNPTSNPQLKALLKGFGIDLPLNRTGGDSTDKEAIMRMRANYPEHSELFDLLVKIRKCRKDIATYAKITPAGDGRVHASFTPVSKDEDGTGKELAGTWRITAKEPNMQNQTPESMRMYVPKPGHCFIVADFGSLEARLLAAFSGDKVLEAAIREDLHAFNSARLGVDRTRAKNGFYGWSYMAGPKTLYNTFIGKGYKVPMKECEALLNGFDTQFSVAAKWRQRLINEAAALRYVQNPFGLRRYFPQQEFPVTRVVNTYIQSSGAFMMWRILPELDEAMSSIGAELLLMVHDNIVAEVPLDKREVAMAFVERIMTQEFPEIAPGWSCPVDVKWSTDSWGATK